MKAIFKNMTWMLSATLIMAACSDSLDESTNTPVQGPVVGEGYVKVAINMPTTSGNSTRSTDNGEDKADVTLEEGEADEYNVENAILAFFKCKTESLANTSHFCKGLCINQRRTGNHWFFRNSTSNRTSIGHY